MEARSLWLRKLCTSTSAALEQTIIKCQLVAFNKRIWQALSKVSDHEQLSSLQAGDLRRLLEMYRDWQQLMLPGMDLDQFLSTAEKFGATNMMKASSTAVLFLLCAGTFPVSWLADNIAQTAAM